MKSVAGWILKTRCGTVKTVTNGTRAQITELLGDFLVSQSKRLVSQLDGRDPRPIPMPAALPKLCHRYVEFSRDCRKEKLKKSGLHQNLWVNGVGKWIFEEWQG